MILLNKFNFHILTFVALKIVTNDSLGLKDQISKEKKRISQNTRCHLRP